MKINRAFGIAVFLMIAQFFVTDAFGAFERALVSMFEGVEAASEATIIQFGNVR